MNLDHYSLEASADLLSFEFISEGPRGRIKKVIQFKKLNMPNSRQEIYNLGFGDFNEEKNSINDTVVSNNKDAEKVMATVAHIVIFFLKHYPNAQIFAQGNTPTRIRYYIMQIGIHLKEIPSSIEIWGALTTSDWELFRKNGPYKALLVKLK